MSRSRALRLGAGFVLFQAAWFACVVGAARGHAGLGIAAVVAVIAVVLAWSTHRAADLGLIALALVTGAFWDSALIRLDILHYASPGPLPGWARYRTPLPGLYLCGAGTHPGGEVTGAPGHNAAHAILRDLLRDVAAGD